MNTRKNISIPNELWLTFTAKVPPGKRSQFISKAIEKALSERDDLLASEYEEAFNSEEYRAIEKDWSSLNVENWE